MGSRRGVARLLSDERDGCAPPLQPQAHRGQHLGPLSALVEALPAELGAPDLRRYDLLDRLLYCHMGRDVQVWDSTGSLLLLGPLPLGQLLVGPLHVAATYLPGSPALRYDEWTWVRGALCTIDRPYAELFGFFDWVHHHIGSTHLRPHLFSNLPCYHAVEATKHLKAYLKPLGLY